MRWNAGCTLVQFPRGRSLTWLGSAGATWADANEESSSSSSSIHSFWIMMFLLVCFSEALKP